MPALQFDVEQTEPPAHGNRPFELNRVRQYPMPAIRKCPRAVIVAHAIDEFNAADEPIGDADPVVFEDDAVVGWPPADARLRRIDRGVRHESVSGRGGSFSNFDFQSI